jgi:hypothetical protein
MKRYTGTRTSTDFEASSEMYFPNSICRSNCKDKHFMRYIFVVQLMFLVGLPSYEFLRDCDI